MIDIGANLTNSSFAEDLEAVLERARNTGVETIVVTGTNVDASAQALSLAQRFPQTLRATAGVHPHDAGTVGAGWRESITELARDEAVVALGEMGLDFYRNYSEPDVQRDVFSAQLELAIDLDMPVFVHDRDSNGEVLEILRRHRPPACVVHCFTGSARDLSAYLAEGFYIGVTGWICDERRGAELRANVGSIPLDRLLVETDSPYLLPRTIRPKPRSRRNEPALLPHVIAEVAAARDLPVVEVAAATAANARRLFRLQ